MPWDLIDKWRDEDGWPPPHAERDVEWWKKTYAEGRAAEAMAAVRSEHGIYREPEPNTAARPGSQQGVCRVRRGRPRDPSARELEVLQLVARGLTDKEIAGFLTISVETAKTHVRNLLMTLHAVNRAHAVAIAWRRCLID